ncbi:MAG TPA: polyprenol monophosphomannose synthase [Phycisphaerae bacterium]|nr:polyprenol monophosphomannose synthase [Phycisphaerae bacterium]
MTGSALTSLDLSIIVPTYREAANLRVLLPRIAAAMKSISLRGHPETHAGPASLDTPPAPGGSHGDGTQSVRGVSRASSRSDLRVFGCTLSYEVLIVDDRSDDDPGSAVREAGGDCPVQLIVRDGPRDLSLAVLDGLRRARGDTLLVMDADLSHPPERIPDLLASLREPPTDFVLGSRFVPGGRTEDWGGHRRLNSRVATLLCRPLAGRIRDPMAGFFALRRETFERATKLDPIGYKIGLELICRCPCRHVVEVPIVFHNRMAGVSKLDFRQQRLYLTHLARLYRDCRPGWGLVVRPILGLMRGILLALQLVTPQQS